MPKLEHHLQQRLLDHSCDFTAYYEIGDALNLTDDAQVVFILSFASRRLRNIDYELNYLVGNPNVQMMAALPITRNVYDFALTLVNDLEQFAYGLKRETEDRVVLMRERGLGVIADQTLHYSHRLAEVYFDCRKKKRSQEETDQTINAVIEKIKIEIGKTQEL